ncbi:MAG: hypothetical protein QME42_06935 [bacterium]|nr:hypothetical protein [bacterium]
MGKSGKSHCLSKSVSCYQCAWGPCQITHDNRSFLSPLKHREKTKPICGDTIDTILARNLLSLLIKGTVSTAICAKYIAGLLLANSSLIKNEIKLQQITKRFGEIDKKELILKALYDIENSGYNPMSFISNYFPELIRQDLMGINMVPHSTSSEILSATHLLTMCISSNPEDFLRQGFRLGLANLGTMIIASELKDTLLPPSRLSKSGSGISGNEAVRPIPFSAGFSFQKCLDILNRLNSTDPLKPLLDWLVSCEIRGFALLIGCTKLNETYISIIKELLKKNILILTAGCNSYSCNELEFGESKFGESRFSESRFIETKFIETEFFNSDATIKYAGRELGNVLCNLSKVTNIERALPPIWHFGSMIDFAQILNFLFAISTRLQIRLKDIPIVAIVNELGIEMPSATGFGILSLGIPVHFGFNESIINSDLITTILVQKTTELFDGRIILETDPTQAAKLLIGSIDEKRMGLNI